MAETDGTTRMLAYAEISDRIPPVSAERLEPPLPVRPALGIAAAGHRAGASLIVATPAHVLRRPAEACIRTVYARTFGASDLVFPPILAALIGEDGEPLCAAGLRCAEDGFFSEIYLDAPIETVLSRRARKPVARDAVFEVTTLASRSVEASTLFLRQLAALGKAAGFQWSFFTATLRLRRLLAHLGAPPLELAPADPRRLGDAGRWGSYYAHAPKVCAVSERGLKGAVAAPAGAR